jgi:hypothetical protein
MTAELNRLRNGSESCKVYAHCQEQSGDSVLIGIMVATPAYLKSIRLTPVHMTIAYPTITIIIDGAIPIALNYVMKHDLDTGPALQVF